MSCYPETDYDHKRRIIAGEAIIYGFDCRNILDDDETLSSISTQVYLDPENDTITLGTTEVNATVFDNDNGAEVAIGKGATVKITVPADEADGEYELYGFALTSKGNTKALRGGIVVRAI